MEQNTNTQLNPNRSKSYKIGNKKVKNIFIILI